MFVVTLHLVCRNTLVVMCTHTTLHMATGIYSGRKFGCPAGFVVQLSARTARRFVVHVSSCTFRRGRFGVNVSARSFRRRQNVLFGHDTLCCSDMTHGPVWKRHIVLCGQHTLSCVVTTHCPVWRPHIVLCGNDTMSCVETTHCPLWRQYNVYCVEMTNTK